MVNRAFVLQAQGDIKRKLQKMEGFGGMNATQFTEVATSCTLTEIRRQRGRLIESLRKRLIC